MINENERIHIFEELVEIINSDDDVVLEHKGKIARLRFYAKSLDFIPCDGDGSWSKTNHILLFEIENREEELYIHLVIGPGLIESREFLHKYTKNYKVFNLANRGQLRPKYKYIFKHTFFDWRKSSIDINEINDNLLEKYNYFKKQFFNEMILNFSDLKKHYEIKKIY